MYRLGDFPSPEALETPAVLRKAIAANKSLAELKGLTRTIPRPGILLNTLALQEARDSSEIENIITTQDDLYTDENAVKLPGSIAAKEVHRYVQALRIGYGLVQEQGILTSNHIITVFQSITERAEGFRVQPGTALVNDATQAVVYEPPQDAGEIIRLMRICEELINDDGKLPVDPLIKMAVIHHLFESIHPFSDGNGRTGRIINVLYLVLKGYLDIPILYLSRYIVRTKVQYYHLLQAVRDENRWIDWVLYMLEGVDQTAQQTIGLVQSIGSAMQEYKQRIRAIGIYSQELLNNLFFHPYTKIEYVTKSLDVSRQTASKYLERLVEAELLEKRKIGRHNYYINRRLMRILGE